MPTYLLCNAVNHKQRCVVEYPGTPVQVQQWAANEYPGKSFSVYTCPVSKSPMVLCEQGLNNQPVQASAQPGGMVDGSEIEAGEEIAAADHPDDASDFVPTNEDGGEVL